MAMFNEDKNLKSGGCADEIAALIRDDLSPKMIQEQLENYHNSDIAKSMEQMDRLGRMRLIRSIEPDKLAGIFKYVEPQEAAAFLKDIDTARAVFILEKIDPDAAADILRELPGSDRSAMIGLLNGALRKKIELLVSFDEDEIGSRMSANFISLDSEMTVGRATRALMDQAKENDNIQMLFVTAENGFFCGTVELRALLIAEKNAAIAPLIQHRFPYVYCSERTEDCIERLKSYSESAIPVLDASNCILGVITLKDLVEAVDDEMSDDYAKLGGLSAEEDLHEPLRASLKKRMPWLLVLLVLGMVVSGVVGAFEKVVSRLTIIMAFQSLILDMAGNVGTQSLAVTIRVLMDKEITARKKAGPRLQGDAGGAVQRTDSGQPFRAVCGRLHHAGQGISRPICVCGFGVHRCGASAGHVYLQRRGNADSHVFQANRGGPCRGLRAADYHRERSGGCGHLLWAQLASASPGASSGQLKQNETGRGLCFSEGRPLFLRKQGMADMPD